MELNTLIERVNRFAVFENILSNIDTGNSLNVRLQQSSLIPVLTAKILEEFNKQIIFITSSIENSEKYYDDFKTIYTHEHKIKIIRKLKSEDVISQEVSNIESLDALKKGKNNIFIFDFDSIVQKIFVDEKLAEESIDLKTGNTYSFEKLLSTLIKYGYDKSDFVFETGEFAQRGGIIDIFPFIGKHPFRIEFYGNNIESIREFDESTQRSINNIESMRITPNFLDSENKTDKNPVFKFFKEDCLIILDGMEELEKYFADAKDENILEKEEFLKCYNKYQHISNFLLKTSIPESFCPNIIPHPNYNSSLKLCYENLKKYSADGYELYILCDGEKRLDTIKNLIDELDKDDKDSDLSIHYLNESLQNGFVSNDEKIVVLTEHEIFGRLKGRNLIRKKKFKGFSNRDLSSIHHGEYVVHIDFGVGIFDKLERIRVGESEQECIKLRYQDGDSLFVNLNYINRVQKYNSTEGIIPKVSKLGSSEWDRLKARTKKRIQDIARDLIALYAKRKAVEGFAFNADTVWQKELEASFMYEDTPDQASATIAVKQDMENKTPMDRLVCGDVGYGKTEVAVRAAFKAVMDSKQVAVLVPTTILAEQHYKTFSQRLKNFPVTVQAISRFKTGKEQKSIVDDLKKKKLDILIGTHRLLSKDIEFKDLGLLVIDEEQRFGVVAKEKLRKIKIDVDTLTLTATPIPRTLNFSLMGARDLSVIETPPKNRLPVETEIIKFDEDIIRNAILKELKRGGQVFFINDKVHNIEKIRDDLEKIVPEAKIGIAHGQMTPRQLQKIMIAFFDKKIEILLATKIMESGIDLPNVNTIFVNRADRFGLAELYQLRGRVGRSNTQAFAYFIIPGYEFLSATALKRLQAIEEFTELSSGFNLAMRDMEIRGVGNLLGAEQSGFVESMGFELYCKILDESVLELKKEEFKDVFDKDAFQIKQRIDVNIEIDSDAFFHDLYITNDAERFNYYQKLYDAENVESILTLRDEITDRFGKMDEEGENLIKMVTLRIYLSKFRASKFNLKRNKITLYFKKQNFEDEYSFSLFNKLIEVLQKVREISFFVKDVKDDVTLNISIDKEGLVYLDYCLNLFKDII
jgi:transcription-repair coupling factor (superfamily II helicase)